VDRHLGTILGLARRMLRDDAEAEDVAQETLLRLWRTGGGLEIGAHGLRPWLRRVASNLCIDRSRSARRIVVVDEVPEEAAPAGQLVALEQQDLARRVDAALQGLPERQRLALTLFHHEGLSQIEVGDIMGISDEAVESLLARARRTLRGELENEWQSLLSEDNQKARSGLSDGTDEKQ
jgi:RNA polymerase sigma-70 factor (ECF subfamily)